MRCLALILLAAGLVAAQADPVPKTLGLPPDPAGPDTLRHESPPPGPVSPETEVGEPGHSSKSPGRAVLLSLAVPGGGQVYTGYWWKAAIIAPAELTLAYLSVRDHQAASSALRAGDEARYLTLRDRRNTLLYFTGAVLAYSMADAWVSARMYRFDRQMEFAAGPGRAEIRLEF
ncbi:MAG: DUF5683 domain-containing protein [bacterium]